MGKREINTEAFKEKLTALGEDKWEVIEGLIEEFSKSALAPGVSGMGEGEKTPPEKEELSEEERKEAFKKALKVFHG